MLPKIMLFVVSIVCVPSSASVGLKQHGWRATVPHPVEQLISIDSKIALNGSRFELLSNIEAVATNATLGVRTHLWPPMFHWPATGWPFLEEHRLHLTTTFRYTFSDPGSNAGRGQTYMCFWALDYYFQSKVWPHARQAGLGVFSYAPVGKNMKLTVKLTDQQDIPKWDLGKEAMRVLVVLLASRGFRSLNVDIATTKHGTPGSFQHLANVGLQLEDGPPPPPRQWPHPHQSPYEVTIPGQPGAPVARLLFPRRTAIPVLFGDTAETALQAILINDAKEFAARQPPHEPWNVREFGSDVEPLGMTVRGIFRTATNDLIRRAMETLRDVVVNRGAIQTDLDIFEADEYKGFVSLWFPKDGYVGEDRS